MQASTYIHNGVDMEKDARARILDTALETFSANGFKGTTTKAIARKAGVNEVTLFRHFGSKKNLFYAVIDREAKVRTGILDVRLEPGTDMVEDLTGLGRAMYPLMAEKARLLRMIMTEVENEPEIWTHISPVPSEAISVIAGYFEKARKKGMLRDGVDSRIAALGLFSFFFRSLVSHAFLGDDVFVEMSEENIRKLVEIYVNGMAAGRDA